MGGLLASHLLAASDRNVDIGRVQLDAAGDPFDGLGGDQRRARPQEGIKDQLAPLGNISEGVGDKLDRLGRRMIPECLGGRGPLLVRSGIGPDVGPIPAVLPQKDIVDGGRRRGAEHDDFLVRRAIEASHAAVPLLQIALLIR